MAVQGQMDGDDSNNGQDGFNDGNFKRNNFRGKARRGDFDNQDIKKFN